MAILKMFTADMPAPFTRMSRNSATYVTRSNTQKRTGTYSMKLDGAANNSAQAYMGIGGTATSLYIGAWVYCEALPSTTYSAFSIGICESTTVHVGIVINNAGAITIRRGWSLSDYNGANGTTLATLATTIGVGQSYFFEIYASIHDSTGAVTVKVNGIQDTAITSQDTRNGGSGYAQNLYFTSGNGYGSSNGGDWYIDDVTIANDWPGQGGIHVLWPSGAGSTSNWTASTGNAYECIDGDANGDGDMTDYISDDTTSDAHDFAVADFSGTFTDIKCVEAVAAATVPTGSATMRVNVMSGGSTANGSDTALSSTVTHVSSGILSVDPATSSAWLNAAVDALTVGVESRA